ncbi:MAG TPA: hypothetical protein VMN57_12365 [Anaerolineales bacterium]|nr:hypothetical protein [Anaerolineales bacterium]
MNSKNPWLVAGMIAVVSLTITCYLLNLFFRQVVVPVVYSPTPVVQPLQDEVVEDLCYQLELPNTDPLCDGSGEVRERDFFPKIFNEIESGRLQNEAEWEERFGTYLVECNEVAENADGIKPTRCTYDFNDNLIYRINVEFINGQFDRIFFLAPDSPG